MPVFGAGSKYLGRTEKETEWRRFHAPQAPCNSHCAPTAPGNSHCTPTFPRNSLRDDRTISTRRLKPRVVLTWGAGHKLYKGCCSSLRIKEDPMRILRAIGSSAAVLLL